MVMVVLVTMQPRAGPLDAKELPERLTSIIVDGRPRPAQMTRSGTVVSMFRAEHANRHRDEASPQATVPRRTSW